MTLTVASQIENEDLIIEQVNGLSHTDKVLSLACSRQGNLLAHGDSKGGVVIRSTSGDFRRLRTAKAGGPVSAVLFHPTDESTVYVASLNGYIDAWTFKAQGSDILSTVEVPGYITSMAISDSGAYLAVGFDARLAVIALPLSDGMSLDCLSMLPHPPIEDQSPPVGERLDPEASLLDFVVPRRLFFMQEDRILVTFITGTRIFSKVDGSWVLTESVALTPDFYMGGTSISPSKRGLSAAGIRGRLDWYSLRSQEKAQISTAMNQGGPLQRNFAVGIEHLDESTVVTGHNLGVMLVLSSSSSEPVCKLGNEGPNPCQHIAFARLEWGYALFGAIWSTQSRSTTINITFLRDKHYVGHSKSPALSATSLETSDGEAEKPMIDLVSLTPVVRPSSFFPSSHSLFPPSSVPAPNLLSPASDPFSLSVPLSSPLIPASPDLPPAPSLVPPSRQSGGGEVPATPQRLMPPSSPTPSLTTPKPPGTFSGDQSGAKSGTSSHRDAGDTKQEQHGEQHREDQGLKQHHDRDAARNNAKSQFGPGYGDGEPESDGQENENDGQEDENDGKENESSQLRDLVRAGVLLIAAIVLLVYFLIPTKTPELLPSSSTTAPMPVSSTISTQSTIDTAALVTTLASTDLASSALQPTADVLVDIIDDSELADTEEYELAEEWMDDSEWEEILEVGDAHEPDTELHDGGVTEDDTAGNGCVPLTITEVLTSTKTVTHTTTVTHAETFTLTKSFKPRSKPGGTSIRTSHAN